MKQTPIISVVLGSYNRVHFLYKAIASVRAEIQALALPCEIIVVDGGSTDGALAWLLEQKDIITIVQHNRGAWHGKPLARRSWGYFMNLAFKCAQGKYICMISDDSLFVPGALRNGYTFFERQLQAGVRVGAVAFYWRNWPDEEAYHIGMPMHEYIYVNHGMYCKAALENIAYLDEETFKFYFADIDVCFRLQQAGYVVLAADDAYVEHYNHATLEVRGVNKRNGDRDYKIFLQRWQPVYAQLTNHTVGYCRSKKYIDTSNTAEQFAVLHQDIMRAHPAVFAQPSRLVQHYRTVCWYTKKSIRFLRSIVRV